MRCGWERVYPSVMSRCEFKSLPTLSYSHNPSLPISPFPSPVTAHQASKLLPTQTHLYLELLEVRGCTVVGSMRSCHRQFPSPLLQPYTTLLVK